MTLPRHAAGLVLALLAPPLCGQDDKPLFGVVRDASGARVEGAVVEILVVPDLGGGRSWPASGAWERTDERGEFRRRERIGEKFVVWAFREHEEGGSYDASRAVEAVPGTPVLLDLVARHHRPALRCVGGEAWAPRKVESVAVRVPRLGIVTTLESGDARAPRVPAEEKARALVYDARGHLIAPVLFDPTDASGEVLLPEPVPHLFRSKLAGDLERKGWLAVMVDGWVDTLAPIESGDCVVRVPDDEALLATNRVFFPDYAAASLDVVESVSADDEAGRKVVADGGRVWYGILGAGSVLTGRLLLNREPLRGAWLRAVSESVTWRDDGGYSLAETPQWGETDKDGRFSFHYLRYGSGPRVVATLLPDEERLLPLLWRPRFPRTFVVCFATAGEAHIDLGDVELTETHWLADVSVSTHDRRPALGAKAWITARAFTGHTERLQPVPIDRGGRFAALVPNGAVTFVAELDGAWGVQSMRISGSCPPASVFPVDMVLDPPRHRLVRVVDPWNEPVAGAEISYWLDWDTPLRLKRSRPPPVEIDGGGRLIGAHLNSQRLCQMFSTLLPDGLRTDDRGEVLLPVPWARGAMVLNVSVDGELIATRKVELDGESAAEVVIETRGPTP